jgi:beta-1,4-mannosyltransferase
MTGARPETSTCLVASFPEPIARNPYQTLLYRHLASLGFELVPAPSLHLRWLWRNRRRVGTLHFHWPQGYYRYEHASPLARSVLTWSRFALFSIRIIAARLLRYRIVWTVHQVYPHESESRSLDRAAAVVLARMSHCLVCHDEATAVSICAELGSVEGKTTVIPHGSYVGVYSEGRPRHVVRSELGIADDRLVFLSFGQVRRYKELGFLVAAFDRAALTQGILLIAGLPLDGDEDGALAEVRAARPNVRALLDYVPDDRVAELFRASDVAVTARGDGGTSGALILALSMGVPVIAAATPAYEQKTGSGLAGWHFEPGSTDSFCAAIRAAASDPEERAVKAWAALELADRHGWQEIAARSAEVLRPG